MELSLKKELHAVAVNFMFNVCDSAQLENVGLDTALAHSLMSDPTRYTPEEIDCAAQLMAQMVAIRFAPQGSDLDRRRFKATIADVESLKLFTGANVLTGVFQDVLGPEYVDSMLPEFAADAELRRAMRMLGANDIANACDNLALGL